MSEIITSPDRFQILYYENGRWNMIELCKCADDSYYSVIGSYDHDVLHPCQTILYECQTVRNLLARYGIIPVLSDGRNVILNRGMAVEQLKALVAEQGKNFDKDCEFFASQTFVAKHPLDTGNTA